MLAFERQLWDQGCVRIAGVDEAGRGPLAGPVVAAAVFLPPSVVDDYVDGRILQGLTDSKQLSPTQRERHFAILTETSGVEIGVGVADVDEITSLNILRATHAAMARALDALPRLPDRALIDGLPVQGLPCASTSVVKGDSLSLSIAAASIVAKVERDRMMAALDRQYPQYGFARHKGYGTAEHRRMLREHGPSPCHRPSFKGVAEFV